MARPRRTNRNTGVPGGSEDVAVEATIKNIEDAWIADRLRGERRSTEQLLSDDYLGATSSGFAQTKPDFVALIGTEICKFDEFRCEERNVKVHGEIVISTGRIFLEGEKLSVGRSADRQHSFRYLRVFKRGEDGQWRLVASQSTVVLPSKL